jgi:hypothetical protein
MSRFRTFLIAAWLLLGAVGAVAQAPPPVPALPDSARITSYSISSSVCSCGVGFAIYGSNTDVDQWIQVFVNGTRYLSTDLTYGWSLSITPFGGTVYTLASAPRPITNAVLTFNSTQTGSVVILGAERPRRLSQFSESRGVAARDLNQAITDQVAVQRETWDRINRAILGQPGEAFVALPPASTRAGNILGFDSNGLPTLIAPQTGGGSGITGPATSVNNDYACWSGTNGKTLSDCGTAPGYNALSGQWGNANCGSPCATGTGGDDSGPINAALAYAATHGGGTVVLPPPPSGHYNVCASPIYVPASTPTAVGLVGTQSGQYDLRVQPGCSGFPTTATNPSTGRSNPSAVVYDPVTGYGTPADKTSGRFFIENLRIDGYCIAKNNLLIEYDPGFHAKGSVFRNAAAGGANIQDGLSNSHGYHHSIDSTNLAINENDPSHTCYTVPTDLPAYNLQSWATDSWYGLVGINAELANYDNEFGGGNNFSGAHGWGYPSSNSDSQAQGQPLATLYVRGACLTSTFVADSYQLWGVRNNPLPSAGMVQSAVVTAGGSGGTPGYVLLTGTTGTGTKATYYGYISSGGVLTGPLLVWKQGNYSANPSSPDPVTGGGLTGATVTPTMGSGAASGYGCQIAGLILESFNGFTSGAGGVSFGDGIFGATVIGGEFAALVTATNCVVGDSAFNNGVVIQDNANCPVNTQLFTGSAAAFGQLVYPFNGTNYVSVNGGSSALLQFQLNSVPTINLTAKYSQFGTTNPGHISAGQTTKPAVSSCGTGAAAAGSTDNAGQVTATGATACTVTFNVAYTSQPFCSVTDNTTAAGLKVTYSTGVSFTVTGLTSGDTFSYICIGQSGG